MARKTDIRLRRSNVLNAIPGSANLSDGELAMNTNTGALYFKKSDSTIITAADNTIFHIDSDADNSGANKKIGIGTTSPNYKLSVNSGTSDWPLHLKSTDDKAGIIIQDDDTTVYVGAQSSKAFIGLTAGAHVNNLNVDSSGNVGIGTTSPSEKLHVTDTVFIDYPDGNGSSLKIGRNDSSNYWEVNHAGADFRLYNTAGSGSDILFGLDPSGSDQGNKVGIGNATPDKKLTVAGDVKIRNGDAFMSANVAGSTRSLISLGTDNILRIKGNDSEGSSNVISMIAGGDVGIGTTSPVSKLHVAGDIKLTGTLFNGTRDEYTNSNLIRLNQRYTGGAVSGTSYFEANEYQKVVTVTPNGSSENYQISGQYYVQSGQDIQTVNFVAALRSDVLPNLAWEIFYDQEDTGVRYIEPFLWTKETTTAGFILGFKVLTGSIYGSVTADVNIIPRNADDKDNVSINTTVQSEQTTIDTGFTNQSFTLRKSVNNNLHGFGTNPASGYRVDVNGNLKATALYSDGYIYHTGDSDTYLQYSTDTVILSAGAQQTHFKGNGRVGINQSNPTAKLHVKNSSNDDNNILLVEASGSTTYGVYLKSAFSGQMGRIGALSQSDGGLDGASIAFEDFGRDIAFRTNEGSNNSEKARILESGEFGIGTTAPQGTLHLRDTTARLYVQSNDGNSAHVTFGDATDVSRGGIEYTTTDDLVFSNNNFAERMRIRYTGAVGIGTSSPAKKLEVDFTGDTVGARFTRSDTTGSSTIEFANSAGVKSTIGFNAGTNKFDINHNSAVRLSVDNNGAVTFNEAFTFPTSIGDPGQVLKVPSTGTTLVWAADAGGGSATVLTDTDGDTKVQVEETADEDIIRFDTAGTERLRIGSDVQVIAATDLNITGANRRLNFTSGSGTIRVTAASSLHLATNNTNRVTVDSGGQVGIGDTTPGYMLDVAGSINAKYSGTNANVIGMHNGSSGEGWIRPFSNGGDFEFNVKYPGGDSDYIFYVNDSTELMRIKESGRVGIGTNNPTYALDVRDDSNILLKLESTGTDQNARMVFSPSDGDKDWNLGASDDGKFTLYDVQNSRTPFAIDMGAASNSLTISSTGNVAMSQNLTVTGNLTVNGTTTTINTATLDVEDKNITLNYSSGDSSGSADGAGITIQDAVDASTDATFNWNATNDRWEISHTLNLQDGDPITWGGNSIVQHTGSKTHIGDNTSSSVLTLTGGNVGILATSPQTGLQVAHDWVNDYGSINISSGQNVLGGLGLRANNVYKGGLIYRDGTAGAYWELTAYSNEPLLFKTNNAERMRISNDGNVGIAEDNPLQALHVVGKQRIQSKATHSSSPALHITDNADDVGDQNYSSIHLDYNITGSDTLATTDRNHRGLFLDIDSDASGGDTTNEHRIYGIDVDLDFNGDSDQVIGAQFHTENNNADSIQTQIFGLRSYAINDTSGTARGTNTYGAWIQAQANHTTTNTDDANLYAVRARTLVSTSADGGRLNDLYGVYSEVEIDDPGQALDVDNVYVGRFTYNNDDTANNNVSIDNAYLVFGDYAGGAASTGNSYGVYMSSTVPKHYFGSNVGIGTTSPSELLHVKGTNGAIAIDGNGSSNTASIKFINDNERSRITSAYDTGGGGRLTFHTDTTGGSLVERMRIDNAGNVGIGTTSPAGNLHIKSVSNVGDALLIIEADADNNVETDNPRIELRQDNNLVAGYIYMEGTGGGTATGTVDNSFVIEGKAAGSDNGSPIHFATGGLAPNQSGGPTNGTVRMTVHEQGNIGIGTTAPASALHIGGAGHLLFERGGEVRSKDTGGTVRTIARIDGSNNLQFGYSGSGLVQFMGGGSYTERMRIHTNGNIAINHDAAPHTLTVNGTISRVNSGGTQVINLQTNSDAGQIAINNSSGTQRIRLDSNGSSWFMGGSVGIGDSSPSAKLHVVGSVLNNSIQDYGIAAFENSNLEGLSIGYDADGGYTYLYSREVGVSSRGLHLNGSIFVDNYGGTVGIGTVTPNNTCSLEIYKNGANSVLRIHDDAGTHAARVHLRSGGNDAYIQLPNTSDALEFRTEGNISTSNTAALKIQTNGRADFGYAVRIEEYQIDTTETSTSATTQVSIHSFAAATFRSARYTVQVTNSTDSAYHTTELLLVHDGTTANITEFGTIFTGTAAEATFDADINSGNVRLLATPASGDSMEFKVIAHSVTV